MSAPRFSIITPVHRPPLALLRAMLGSLAAQTEPDWELCVVDDGSNDDGVTAELAAFASHRRVRMARHAQGRGIVAASNAALALATGEFVVLVDHDDRLTPGALASMADAIDANPEVDYLYSDEDKLAPDGTVYDTFRKPDWSPERLRSQNYCTHLSVLRRSLVDEVGGFRTGFDGSQDHDLILRVSERARLIVHVPDVLYHWCITPGSTAGDAEAKPYAREAGRRAVAEHLDRLGVDATVEHLATPGHFRVRRTIPDPAPRVSIVVPTAGNRRPVWGVTRTLVVDLLDSLFEVTDYPDIEVVVVTDPRTPSDVRGALDERPVTVIDADGPFNFSRWCNAGVAASSGELVLLLNDDMRVEQPDWLRVMVGILTAADDVGVVGARLLYADGTLQHGGILLNEQPLHIFHGFGGDDPGVFGLLEIDREVSAVTGACLLTRRSLWDRLGGLPEEFAVAFNDLDYCLRVRASGGRVIWTPHATLYHFESQSRQPDADPDEIARLYRRWSPELHRDPYGNPHFAPRQAMWLEADRATGRAVARRSWRQLRSRHR
ncbi:MAG: glycosyltransferase family 2 protein [Desertimonas sp.]